MFEVTLHGNILPSLSPDSAPSSQPQANPHTSSPTVDLPATAAASAHQDFTAACATAADSTAAMETATATPAAAAATATATPETARPDTAAATATPTVVTHSSDTPPLILSPITLASQTPDCDVSSVPTMGLDAAPGVVGLSQAALPPPPPLSPQHHAWVVWVDVSLTPRLWTTTTEWKGSASSTAVLNALQKSPASALVAGESVATEQHVLPLPPMTDEGEMSLAAARAVLLLDCPVDPLQQSQHFR